MPNVQRRSILEAMRNARQSEALQFLKHVCRNFERAEARGMIVDLGGSDDFIGSRFVAEFLQAAVNSLGRADRYISAAVFDGGPLFGSPMVIHIVDRRWKGAGMTADKTQDLQLCRSEKPARFCVGVAGINAGSDDYI